MNDQASGSTYDNAGFQHEDGRPPPTVPQNGLYPSFPPATPSYVGVSPKTINTHTTVTPGALRNMGRKTVAGMKKCPWKYVLCASLSLLLVLTVLGVLLWYFLYYQCFLGKACASGGKCLSHSQWCNGVKDCPNGEDEYQCFRLHGTNFMLEVYSSGKWLPVCAENWDNYDGRDVCEQMGYKSPDLYPSSQISVDSSASKGYMKLKSGSYYGDILSQLVYSQNCFVRAVKLQCVECGVSSAPSSARIVGGTQAANGAWPWQVSLQIDGRHVCGGSIISPDWILSAAHCFQKNSSYPGVWTVRLGDVSLIQMSYNYDRRVNKIIRHGKYNTRTNDYDVALLKLNSSLRFTSRVKPVCLPNSGVDFSAGRHAWITGWGALQSSGRSPDRLNQAQVTVYSRETCNSPQVLDGRITNSMICAGELQGGVDTCQGDSGGPLVVKDGGLWWLAGDTSWGFGCAARNKPGVYGNVSYFINWVYEQMQNE